MRDPERIGPYQIVRRLGQGGMGVVYEARHPMVPRRLALKLVLESRASETARARFFREAEALAKVRHPAVVQVHQLGRASEGPYLVQELVEGQPLSAVCKQGPLEPARACRLAAAIARGVEAVHAIGIIHRDIKPQNVMLRPDDAPVLLDFGLARDQDAETLTRTGELLGTPAYMPPEQTTGRADARSDVYAVGAVLLEMLTGQPPFSGDSAIQLVHSILTVDPVWPRVRRPEVPEGVDAIVRMAMAKRPEARYPTAAALAEDLERESRGEPPHALTRARTGRARRGVVGAVGALVAVALASAAIVTGVVASRPGTTDVATPTTTTSAEAATTPSPPTPTDPLWVLAPGELRYALALENRTATTTYVYTATLVIRPQDGGRLECRLAEFGAQVVQDMARPSWSSDMPPELDAENALSPLRAALDVPFTCALDPASGAITETQGYDAIQRAVLERAQRNPATQMLEMSQPGAQPFAAFVRSALSDGYVESTMDGLTHVRGTGLRVPWTADPAAPPGEPRFVPAAAPHGFAVRDLHAGLGKVRFEGQARYAGGRLLAAHAVQTSESPRSTVTWSATLVPRE